MSKKSRERRLARLEAQKSASVSPSTVAQTLRRRRNRRFLYLGLIAASFPLFELVAYQFRGITLTFLNQTDLAMNDIKVIYPGGEFQIPELKPRGSASRLIRPNFSFKSRVFSTYTQSIRFITENGERHYQMGPVGTLDYSANEVYAFTQLPPDGRVQLQHTTRPGFPLSLVRHLMNRLGFG